MQTVTRLLCGVSVMLVLAAADAAARPRTFVAGQGVRMKVDVPAGYSFETETNQHGVMLVKMENPVWNISISVLISPEYSVASESEDWQRNIVVTHSADFLALSKEQDYKFLPLKPAQGSGVYCVFTDPDAKRAEDLAPGEFMHVVVGAKVIPGAAMYFQIFNNDVRSEEYLEVFDLFINGFDKA